MNIEHLILDWQEVMEKDNRHIDLFQSDRRNLATALRKAWVEELEGMKKEIQKSDIICMLQDGKELI